MNSIWIARDRSGFLFAYSEKPVIYNGSWIPSTDEFPYDIDERLFPEVTFENSPIELIPKISFDRKLVEDYIKDLKNQLDFTEVRKFAEATLDDKAIDLLIKGKKD